MNMAVIKSYWRSIQRGTRTIENVPDALREAVSALGTGEEAQTLSGPESKSVASAEADIFGYNEEV